jgi:alpha-tubulin suppressor-like RCC1 family protein
MLYLFLEDGTIPWPQRVMARHGHGEIILTDSLELEQVWTAATFLFQVSGLTGVVQVAGGDFHSLALKNNGTVWVWGDNGNCQFGNGFPLSSSTVPVQVPAFTNVVAIATGRTHCLAIKNDSTLWAWGDNTFGQLGDSTTNLGCIPALVNGLSGIVAVAAGYGHTLALKSDGTVWTWGENDHGQLGDGNNTDRYFPVQVSGLFNVTAIAAGIYHSLIKKADGTVWAWGENQAGQLGIGNNNSSTIPVQITGLCQIPTTAEDENSIPPLDIPNPVTTELVVRSSELGDINEIIIYNPLGEKVFQSHVSNLTSQISVDVSQLPSGIYFIRVKTDKGIRTKNFVKQ